LEPVAVYYCSVKQCYATVKYKTFFTVKLRNEIANYRPHCRHSHQRNINSDAPINFLIILFYIRTKRTIDLTSKQGKILFILSVEKYSYKTHFEREYAFVSSCVIPKIFLSMSRGQHIYHVQHFCSVDTFYLLKELQISRSNKIDAAKCISFS
jgi:hypothetical protein